MEFKIYKHFAPEAKLVREEVFLSEQGFSSDYDEMDDVSTHFVIFDGDVPVAACRIYESETPGIYVLGRLSVRKTCRGKGIGRIMVQEVEKYALSIGIEALILHSQYQAKNFYGKLGFEEYGDVEYEEGCPLIWMKKILK